MPTECNNEIFQFPAVEHKAVVAWFDGGKIAPDAGVLLPGLAECFVRCFTDRRDAGSIEHAVDTILKQRRYGIALGCKDLNRHDEPRYDPLPKKQVGKLKTHRKDCAPQNATGMLKFPSSVGLRNRDAIR